MVTCKMYYSPLAFKTEAEAPPHLTDIIFLFLCTIKVQEEDKYLLRRNINVPIWYSLVQSVTMGSCF